MATSVQKRLTGKYVFQLTSIDPVKIQSKYGIKTSVVEELEKEKDYKADNITPLVELNTDASGQNFSFLDESKKPHRCKVFFIDISSDLEISNVTSKCFWCKYNFTSSPIGCPVKFIPSTVIRKYISAVNKESYAIKENVSEGSLNRIKSLCDEVSIDNHSYYDNHSYL